MEQSMTLMSAQIHFVDAQLSLVHIPLHQYRDYLQSILRLLFPTTSNSNRTADASDLDDQSRTSWANQHPFLNVSITPVECSIVCSSELARLIFAPTIAALGSKAVNGSDQGSISSEDLVVISVEGEGLEAGQRVLELTTPLALAGISIFFITTYFSDYILVPSKSRGQVIRALEDRGFTFQKTSDTYVNPLAQHHRSKSSTSSLSPSLSHPSPPLSPSQPPSPTTLQSHTFTLLRQHHITPYVDPSIRLLSLAARRSDPHNPSSVVDDLLLQLGVTKCLIHTPKFLSLTLTGGEGASLVIEGGAIPNFTTTTTTTTNNNPNTDNNETEDVLLGSKYDYLVPITLDLTKLPFEATGIVCGVAGRLVAGDVGVGGVGNGGGVGGWGGEAGGIEDGGGPIEMSYLSTARAGTVMVDERDLERAMRVLRGHGGG